MSRKSKVKNEIVKTVPAPGSVIGEKKVVEQKKEENKDNCCGNCKYWDKSTMRDFKRFGVREGLIECRSICRAPKEHSKASGHLTMRESVRPCFLKGEYVPPKKEEKENKNTESKAEKKKDHKTNGKVNERAVAVNGLNGEAKILETNGKNSKVVVKAVA